MIPPWGGALSRTRLALGPRHRPERARPGRALAMGRDRLFAMADDREREFPNLPRFEIRRRLGVGGMGEVYEAYDREQNAVVAVKLLRKLSPRALGRLKSEFRSVVNVRDRNLVRLRELGLQEGEWFITMEYVDGVSFLDWVRPDVSSPAEGDD